MITKQQLARPTKRRVAGGPVLTLLCASVVACITGVDPVVSSAATTQGDPEATVPVDATDAVFWATGTEDTEDTEDTDEAVAEAEGDSEQGCGSTPPSTTAAFLIGDYELHLDTVGVVTGYNTQGQRAQLSEVGLSLSNAGGCRLALRSHLADEQDGRFEIGALELDVPERCATSLSLPVGKYVAPTGVLSESSLFITPGLLTTEQTRQGCFWGTVLLFLHSTSLVQRGEAEPIPLQVIAASVTGDFETAPAGGSPDAPVGGGDS